MKTQTILVISVKMAYAVQGNQVMPLLKPGQLAQVAMACDGLAVFGNLPVEKVKYLAQYSKYNLKLCTYPTKEDWSARKDACPIKVRDAVKAYTEALASGTFSTFDLPQPKNGLMVFDLGSGMMQKKASFPAPIDRDVLATAEKLFVLVDPMLDTEGRAQLWNQVRALNVGFVQKVSTLPTWAKQLEKVQTQDQ